jgi:hypothetical protein
MLVGKKKTERKGLLGKYAHCWEDLIKYCGKMWIGFIWPRIGASAGLL